MARPWRLRHKLVLGLALVVGSVVLLLGGTLFGLSSYLETMQTTGHKLERMQIVVQLRDHIQRITFAGQTPHTDDGSGSHFNAEKEQVLSAIQATRLTVQAHSDALQRDSARFDPHITEDEARLLELLVGSLDRLEQAVARVAPNQFISPGDSRPSDTRLLDDPEVSEAHTRLTQHSNDLFRILISDIEGSFERSESNHRRSLTIAGFATALAIVLVLTLLYYFRIWVFSPIKQLQAGVHRVHEGNFDSPIRLGSKDELEELANEFNAMTTRLREVYKDLARQVNERTRQLVRSERMVSVGFLAAGVAHEINNPLASIAFCAEALERRLQDLLARAPGESEVVLKYLRMMQDEAQRCKQITQKLLDFSRSGGKREPAEMTQLIQDVIEVAQCLPTARGKQIVFHPDSALFAPVRVPEIKGVVLNVVVNGLESMEEGGVLNVSLTTRGDYAEMTFTDTGCGMSPDVLENLFEPFFTRSRTGHGTGLGLATSHLVIDQHGGTIAVTSQGPGTGSTFTIRLPLKAAPGAGDGVDRPRPGEGTILAFPGQQTAAA